MLKVAVAGGTWLITDASVVALTALLLKCACDQCNSDYLLSFTPAAGGEDFSFQAERQRACSRAALQASLRAVLPLHKPQCLCTALLGLCGES